MDPLSGLSLACNIMQVISFSAETIKLTRQLCNGKPPDSDVKAAGQSLMTATTSMKQSLQPGTTDAALVQVAEDLIAVAKSLDEQLVKLTPSKNASKLHSFGKSLAYQMKRKGDVDKLFRQLDRLQSLMQTELLINLRATLKEQQLSTTELGKDLQNFYIQILNGSTRVEDLVDRESGHIKTLVTQEAQTTRDHTTDHAQKTQALIVDMERNRISDAAYQRFLQSFRFPQFNERRNAIQVAHTKTFQWIYQESGTATEDNYAFQGKNNFRKWLRDGAGIYWISGKPGAGKSTLMKFLLEDERTGDIINETSSEPILTAAFIWSAGSVQQRSFAGVLGTLLHGAFAQDAKLCRRAMTSNKIVFEAKSEFTDWSSEELNELFISLDKISSRSICVFVDGLDEIDRSDPTTIRSLMSWLDRISLLEHFKICVSSRPEHIFELKLSQCPHLRVHDLTARDIRAYVSSSLGQLDCGFEIPEEKFQELTGDIIRRAQGVFLWVRLVVEHIRTDLDNFPTWPALVERVESLPPDLDQMYQAMWERQNGSHTSIHRAEAALYLNVLTRDNPRPFVGPNLIEIFLATDLNIQKSILGGGSPVSLAFLTEACSRLQPRVLARCAGLVHLHHSSQPHEYDKQASYMLFYWTHIRFIHRSAKDFLLDTAIGHSILSHNTLSVWENFLRQVNSLLCEGVISRNLHEVEFAIGYIGSARQEIRDPVLYSAFFELLLAIRVRRCNWDHPQTPPWIDPGISSLERDNLAWVIKLSIALVVNGFGKHVLNYMRSLPQDQRLSMANSLVIHISDNTGNREKEKTLEFVIDLLEFYQEAHLRRDFSPFKSAPIAWYFFHFTLGYHYPDSSKLDIYTKLLLEKCGDFGDYIDSPILTVSGAARSSFYMPRYAGRIRMADEDHEGKWLVLLVQTSILSSFFQEGSRLQEVYQKTTHASSPKISGGKPTSEKTVMILELIRDDQELIVDFCSKTIEDTVLRVPRSAVPYPANLLTRVQKGSRFLSLSTITVWLRKRSGWTRATYHCRTLQFVSRKEA
ncbi:unnamed protein product [Periconia digitata]|uniref:NACHT domain-containing protein n=1 Tax=Periconia digitata TaxID=1303443 RepID=A0A9W4U6D1_9PLEO|nr:unnamed protein product [Periconia digitata]